MTVHILATCRSEKLLHHTLCVFDTIRVGFPTAHIVVHGNDLPDYAEGPVLASCELVDATYRPISKTIHHRFVKYLCEQMPESFVVCDTDMVFYDKVEDWKFDTALAGFFIPEWQDDFSGCITRPRLHTSLLFVNPQLLRDDVRWHFSQVPDTDFTPIANLYYPQVVPLAGELYFYDTASLLYHAVGGTAFTAEQKDAYFHFNFGTIEDIVLPRLKDREVHESWRELRVASPSAGKGSWRGQMDYYARNAVKKKSVGLPPPSKTPRQHSIASQLNAVVCNGNAEAHQFNSLWYTYCHNIDDLIDGDNGPISAEAKLEIFAVAAALYNCNFYRQHQAALYPIVLMVTNAYADSVKWEDSDQDHQRKMADVLRMAGNEMYNAVALITGGWQHMRSVSSEIRDQDWIGQHE